MRREREIEEALTRQRHERKLTLTAPEAERLCKQLEKAFGKTNLAETRITSVYFDCADGRFARRALADPENSVKLRTKEYEPDYDNPQGAARCVLDLKKQRGRLITKHRSWIPRGALRAIFSGDAEAVRRFGHAALTAFARVRAAAGGERLMPVIAVSYRRRVFQASSDLRVTVDRELAFHRGDPELFLGPDALTAERLGTPVGRDERIIVEVKHVGENVPAWISPLIEVEIQGLSKFGAAIPFLSG